MNRRVEKIDNQFAREIITFQSRTEYNEYLRVRPARIPSTHKFSERLIEPTEEALRKNPALMPEVVRELIPLGVREISETTDGFKKLSFMELRWLCENYGVAPDKDEKDESMSMIKSLRRHLEATPTSSRTEPATESSQTNRPVTVLPGDLQEATNAQLDDEAARLGVHDQFSKLRFKSIQTKREFIAQQRISRNEKLEPSEKTE